MRATKLEQAWNAPTSGQKVAEAFTPDGVRIEHAKPGARLEGREAIARHTQAYIDAVPDCVLDIRDIHEADGTTTLEWTFRGTHTGDVEGFPARGEAIHLDGISVLIVEDGLVREERVYWDAATLFGLME
jgi:steroid delta-isomerase-like uncharacterized protein